MTPIAAVGIRVAVAVGRVRSRCFPSSTMSATYARPIRSSAHSATATGPADCQHDYAPAPEVPDLERGPDRSDYQRARLIRVVASGWCVVHVRWMAEHATGGDCKVY